MSSAAPSATAPVLTRLMFNLELWVRARLLPLQVPRASLDAALMLATLPSRFTYPGLSVPYVVHRVLRTARHPWLMRDRRCLRQGLLGFRFLRAAGHDPRLCFGVDPASMTADRISAHCWIEVGGQTVLGLPDSPLVTIYVYPSPEKKCL